MQWRSTSLFPNGYSYSYADRLNVSMVAGLRGSYAPCLWPCGGKEETADNRTSSTDGRVGHLVVRGNDSGYGCRYRYCRSTGTTGYKSH